MGARLDPTAWECEKLARQRACEEAREMTPNSSKLTETFTRAFTAEERARVRAHLAAGTRILCGKSAFLFFTPGAG